MHVLGWLIFGIATVVAGSVIIVLSLLPGTRPLMNAIPRWWAALAYVICGADVPDELIDAPPDDGPFVVMANHEGVMDVLLFIWTLPLNVRFVAKKELAFVPVFGLGMWRLGHIFIDRRNRGKAIDSLKRAGRKIRAGTNVLVYPEGTRNPDPNGPLLPFKKGGFMLAIAAQVPILPVGVAGAGKILPKGQWRFRRGSVCYRIGEPIPTAGLTDADRNALMADVHTAIADLRDQARADRAAYEKRQGRSDDGSPIERRGPGHA